VRKHYGGGVEEKIRSLFEDPSFKLCDWHDHQFSDGEFLPQIGENVRHADVYIIQPTDPPADNFKCLKLLLMAAADASAARVTAVLPYFGGLRQDRKDRPRVPITAKQNAIEIEAAMQSAQSGHIMILQPHFPQIQIGFRRISSDLLYPTDIFLRCVEEEFGGDFSKLVPTACDIGAVRIVAAYAKRLDLDYAVGDKRRTKDDEVEIRNIYGDVRDKIPVVFDDIVDTAGSLVKLAYKLQEMGAEALYGYITSGIFAGNSLEKLQKAYDDGVIKKIVVTDAIMRKNGNLPDFITVVTCGELIGEAIYRNHTDKSISAIDGMFSSSGKK